MIFVVSFYHLAVLILPFFILLFVILFLLLPHLLFSFKFVFPSWSSSSFFSNMILPPLPLPLPLPLLLLLLLLLLFFFFFFSFLLLLGIVLLYPTIALVSNVAASLFSFS